MSAFFIFGQIEKECHKCCNFIVVLYYRLSTIKTLITLLYLLFCLILLPLKCLLLKCADAKHLPSKNMSAY